MFAEIEDIKNHSRYKDRLENLDDDEITFYSERADIYIQSKTGRDYSKTKDESIKTKLKIATIKLVDYLFYFDTEYKMTDAFRGIKSENTPDYSYSITDNVMNFKGLTGDKELDLILDSLTPSRKGFNYFSVNGPTSARHRGGRIGI